MPCFLSVAELLVNPSSYSHSVLYTMWLVNSVAVVAASHLQLTGSMSKSQSRSCQATTTGNLFTHIPLLPSTSVTVGKVTADYRRDVVCVDNTGHNLTAGSRRGRNEQKISSYPKVTLMLIGVFTFLPRDARSAKRGIAIVSRPSVRPSVCPSVRPSVTLTYRGHIRWTSSKLIIRIISLGSSLLGATTLAI